MRTRELSSFYSPFTKNFINFHQTLIMGKTVKKHSSEYDNEAFKEKRKNPRRDYARKQKKDQEQGFPSSYDFYEPSFTKHHKPRY